MNGGMELYSGIYEKTAGDFTTAVFRLIFILPVFLQILFLLY